MENQTKVKSEEKKPRNRDRQKNRKSDREKLIQMDYQKDNIQTDKNQIVRQTENKTMGRLIIRQKIRQTDEQEQQTTRRPDKKQKVQVVPNNWIKEKE